MKQQQFKRTRWLTIRMSETEYQQVGALAKQTTCNSISEYARKVVLGKPVILRYRNQSLDDFLADMVQLKQDLASISSYFTQAVQRLHSLNKISEIQEWILHNEQDKTQLFRQIETISNKINETYKLWSQE